MSVCVNLESNIYPIAVIRLSKGHSKMLVVLLLVLVAIPGVLLAAAEDTGKRDMIKQYLVFKTDEWPFHVPVEVKACVVNKTPVKLDLKVVEETLSTLQSLRIPRFLEEDAPLEGIQYRFRYSVRNDVNCSKETLGVILEEALHRKGAGGSNSQADEAGILRVRAQVGAAELAGRVAGWILSQSNALLAPDLSRKLFFSLLEDDGIETSIVGFHHQSDSVNPLSGLNLRLVGREIQGWIGSDANKTIVKATTRDIDDHPGVLQALLHSRQSHATERYDPATGRFVLDTAEKEQTIDPIEFLNGVAQSSDALFRAESTARLLRLRRREVEVYAILAKTTKEVFRDRSRLFAGKSDVLILVPPSLLKNFNLSHQILLGLADSVAGVRSNMYFESTLQDSFWLAAVRSQASRNVVLNELSQSLTFIREALTITKLSDDEMVKLVDDLYLIQSRLEDNDLRQAQQLIRGSFKSRVLRVVRAAKAEKKKCCENRVLVNREDVSGRSSILKGLYALVGLSLVVGSSVGAWAWSQGRASQRDLKTLFGRQHLD